MNALKIELEKPAPGTRTPGTLPDDGVPEDEPDFLPASWKIFAFPAMLLISTLLYVIPFFRLIFTYFFCIPIHEIGHAMASWLGCRFAFPLGAFIPMAAFTVSNYQQTFIGVVSCFIVVGGLGYNAFKFNNRFLMLLFAIALFFAIQFTFIMPTNQWEIWMVFDGVGGEFWISSLLMIAYFHRLPRVWYWETIRFPALFVGTFVYIAAVWRWNRISHGLEPFPTGTFIGGSGDTGGDLDRLFRAGWTEGQIIRSYFRIAKVGGAIVLAHYFYSLRQTFVAKRP